MSQQLKNRLQRLEARKLPGKAPYMAFISRNDRGGWTVTEHYSKGGPGAGVRLESWDIDKPQDYDGLSPLVFVDDLTE